MTRTRLLLTIVAALGSLAVTCETDIIDDAGFQLWCGSRLCVWDTEQGEILKVATWHTNDYGVELVGSPVLLSTVALGGASSVRVEAVSRIEDGAMVSVEIDGDGDGRVDASVAVPPSGEFVSREWRLSVEVDRGGIFYIRKSGEGEAVFARLLVSR